MKNKSVKNMHKVRNAVMMVLLSILMLSTGTFAWFTMSKTAQVNSLSMKVGTKGGSLQIGRLADTSKAYGTTNLPKYDSSELTLTSYTKAGYLPATSKGATTDVTSDEKALNIYKPTDDNYTNKVSDVTATTSHPTTDTEAANYYYYQDDFYLRASGSDINTDLKLDDKTKITNSTSADKGAIECMRIAVTTTNLDSNETKIFDISKSGSTLKDGTKAIDEVSTDYAGYTPTTLAEGKIAEGTTVDVFSIPTNKDVHVILQVWFEGKDPECVNEIMTGGITGLLEFVTSDTVTTTTPTATPGA